MSNTSFSAKEQKKRYELLNERPAWIIFKTAMPLLFFSFMKVAFQFFDVLTISKIDQNMVSTALFVSDIQSILDCLFMAMAIGVGIRISQAFGAGDFDSIKRDLSTVFFAIIFISLFLVLICIPFAKPILRFFMIPEEMLEIGSTYFSISIFSAIFAAVNVLYFASEKARGRTKVVSVCNIVQLITKLFFNFIIMYLINQNVLNKEHAVILLPLSVCVSQFLIMLFAFRGLFSKDSPFRVSFRSASFDKEFLSSYFKLTLPVILIKSMTPLAKVICNSQYAVFGSIGLAAFSCCNKICSIATAPLDALQDAETAVIAANIGNRKYERVRKTMHDSLWLVCGISIILFAVVFFVSETLIRYFAGGNEELLKNIRILYSIEKLDFIFMALDCIFTAYLFATKKTKLKTVSSFLQRFVIRIPLLYFLINHFGFGIEAIALSILISNIGATLFTIISYLYISRTYERKLKENEHAETRLIDAVRALGRLDAFDTDKGYSEGIKVPIDLIELMKETFAVNIKTDTLVNEYRYALVEARIDELEKQENSYTN